MSTDNITLGFWVWLRSKRHSSGAVCSRKVAGVIQGAVFHLAERTDLMLPVTPHQPLTTGDRSGVRSRMPLGMRCIANCRLSECQFIAASLRNKIYTCFYWVPILGTSHFETLRLYAFMSQIRYNGWNSVCKFVFIAQNKRLNTAQWVIT